MCVTQRNCIEIKANYGPPVGSYLHLAISNLLFQVLLTSAEARQSLGRVGQQHPQQWETKTDNNESQLIWSVNTQKSEGSNLARTALDLVYSLRVRLQINSPEPNLSSAESYGCWEVNLKTKRGTSNRPYLSTYPKQCLLKAKPCACLLN